MGWIPSIDEMPTSAIIGYVDVVGVTTESDSVWADEETSHPPLHIYINNSKNNQLPILNYT